MKFLMNALKNCLAANGAPTPMHQAAVAVVWASRRRHKPCPRSNWPADCSVAKPAGPACPCGPAGAPGGTPAPAPAPDGRRLLHLRLNLHASTPELEPAPASAVSQASVPPVAPTAADTLRPTLCLRAWFIGASQPTASDVQPAPARPGDASPAPAPTTENSQMSTDTTPTPGRRRQFQSGAVPGQRRRCAGRAAIQRRQSAQIRPGHHDRQRWARHPARHRPPMR